MELVDHLHQITTEKLVDHLPQTIQMELFSYLQQTTAGGLVNFYTRLSWHMCKKQHTGVGYCILSSSEEAGIVSYAVSEKEQLVI